MLPPVCVWCPEGVVPTFVGGGDLGEAIETGADAPPEEEFPTEDLVLEGAVDDDNVGEGAHGEEVRTRLSSSYLPYVSVLADDEVELILNLTMNLHPTTPTLPACTLQRGKTNWFADLWKSYC